jgi:peptide/nickel transport system substrate-binding protein
MKASSKLTALLWLVVIASMALASCTPTAAPVAPAATEAAPAATEAPKPAAERKVATFIWTQEFDTLNPLYTNMWFSSITQQIWSCAAWVFDDQNQLKADLVKEIPSVENGLISADGKTITLKLRDDIKWHDGEPITSKDFDFTYKMYMADKNAVASRTPYDSIEKLETPDATTVIVTFKEPYAPWGAKLFFNGMLPAHVLQPVFDKDGTIDAAEWNKAPKVGCGPFKFESWESGSFARFVANDSYWLGRPKLDEIFFKFVPDDASQIAALKTGEGDLGTFFAYGDLPDLEAAGIKILKSFSGYNEGWYFNFTDKGHPAIKDLKVRQAMAYGFDRFSLVKDLLLGRTEVAATMWDNTPWVDPSIKPYPYDPEKAKALLDEAGWKDSNGDGVRDKDGVELKLKFGTTTRQIRQDTQAVLQNQFKEIGIALDLQTFDSDIYFAGYGENGPIARGEMDFYQYSTVTAFPDPDSSDFLCREIPSDENPAGVNWSALCDEELDKLFNLETSQVDLAARTDTFHKITKIMFDKVYWLGVWQDPDLFGISSRLQNVKISGANPFFNIYEWDLTAK